jgi:MFS family permease
VLSRPLLLICLTVFCNTFSIGAFPVLLPEVGRVGGFDDLALGAIAGAFGLARLLTDIPAGLFITHHVRRAIVLGAVALVTLIMRLARPGALSFSLNAYEMSAMLGVLGGMICTGAMPRHWPWNMTLLLASLPLVAGLLILPALLKSVPRDSTQGDKRPLFSRGASPGAEGSAPMSRLTVLVLLTGFFVALCWSAVGQFVLPLRASRDFEFSRQGLSLLLAIPQVLDALFLLPVGMLADRISRARVLGTLLVVLGVGAACTAFGSLPVVFLGCVLFGLGLTAWMIPVGLLNQDGPPAAMAWRTSLYRLGVDGGIFMGPLASGYLAHQGWLDAMGALCASVLVLLGVLIVREHAQPSTPAS